MYFIIIALVVLFDQLTKYLVQLNMELNTSISLIDGIFHITYIQNRGAAFSLFEGKIELLVIQLLVIGAIFIYLLKDAERDIKFC